MFDPRLVVADDKVAPIDIRRCKWRSTTRGDRTSHVGGVTSKKVAVPHDGDIVGAGPGNRLAGPNLALAEAHRLARPCRACPRRVAGSESHNPIGPAHLLRDALLEPDGLGGATSDTTGTCGYRQIPKTLRQHAARGSNILKFRGDDP